jgi:cell division protease FtsH
MQISFGGNKMDAWFPINYPLPGNFVYKKTLSYGANWQIIDTTQGKALIVKNELIDKWADDALIEKEYFQLFEFGKEKFGLLKSGKNHILEYLGESLYEIDDINDALSFAKALRITREKNRNISLSDGIFVEKISLILPTYTNAPKLTDDMLLGKWVTSGVFVSIFSSQRITQLTLWSETQIKQIRDEAGLVKTQGIEPETTNQKSEKFNLPGRPEFCLLYTSPSPRD